MAKDQHQDPFLSDPRPVPPPNLGVGPGTIVALRPTMVPGRLNGHASLPPLVLDPKAPLDNARIIVERDYTHDGLRTLQHQQSIFCGWTGTHYRHVLPEEMRAKIYEFLETAEVPFKATTKPFAPTARSVSDVLDALRAAAQLSATVRAPAWLEDADNSLPDPKEIISCKNGLLHLPTGKLFSHSPNFYAMNSLTYDYDPDAKQPIEWQAFLKSIWENDPESIDALQDLFGYYLGSDTDQQKIPMIVGPKRSGKGTLGRVLTAMIGPSAVVSPTLASLATNFGLAPLIGKTIGIISDARLSTKADQQAIAERLLSISGEDLQTIDRKFTEAWSGQLGVRFLILTNELPRIVDSSGALASRFIIFTMTQSFYGKEDKSLTKRLLTELPGILNWAIQGWRNVRKRGYLLQPASSREAIQELEDLGSPIGAFLRECCEVGQGNSCSIDGIYSAWQTWCHQQGRDHSGTKQTFGRDLRAAIPGLSQSHPRDGNDRIRTYEGVKLQERLIHQSDNGDFGQN